MSSIKNVVKVMNFHSLLRVDKARKKAEKYLSVGEEITKILTDIDNYKIIIGSKIVYKDNKTVLKLEKDLFNQEFTQIRHYIEKSLLDMSYREINIYYNHYYTSTTFEFKKVNVFPLEFKGEYYSGVDYTAETNLQNMLKSLVAFYICYQLKMCECISEAAENLNRNQITSMALDKIEEKEEEKRNQYLRKRNEEACFKNVENYKKIIQIGDNNG